MNWIGGARARAKLKEQSNVSRVNRQPTDARNLAALMAEDDDEEEQEGAGAGIVDGDHVFRVPAGPAADRGRTRHVITRKPDDGSRLSFDRNVDYAALGYRLARPEKDERRVVPLLEFLETKIPNGQVLSLQLSHLVDITRTPTRMESPAMPRHFTTRGSSSSPTTDTSSTASSSFNILPTPPPQPVQRPPPSDSDSLSTGLQNS